MVMDSMEKMFDKQIDQLTDKEKVFWLKAKNFIFKGYNSLIKPILIAIFMFWLFDKIKNVVGIQEAMFIQLTVIIIFLRIISSRIK